MNIKALRRLTKIALILGLSSCIDQNHSSTGSQVAAIAPGNMPKLMAAEKLARIKAALPKVVAPKIQEILDSADTLWYSHEEMKPAYQDSVADLMGYRTNAHAFSREVALIAGSAPGAREIFSRDDLGWEYPFAKTAGTDNSSNIEIINFISLPKRGNEILPVVYWIDQSGGSFGGKKWKWMFPKGTVLGEMIFTTSGGKFLATEIRTRTRYETAWSTNAFRAFPTVESLIARIKEIRPQWESDAAIKSLIDQLANPNSLRPVNLNAKGPFAQAFQQTGHVDDLPAFTDQTLAEELLKTTPFESSYNQVWKQSAERVSYAASSKSGLSVFPEKYDAGAVPVNEESCKRCHQDGGRPIRQFVNGLMLYGDIWGMDQIFSFQIWEDVNPIVDGVDRRKVRTEFASSGLVVPYNASTHPADYYQKAPTNYQE